MSATDAAHGKWQRRSTPAGSLPQRHRGYHSDMDGRGGIEHTHTMPPRPAATGPSNSPSARRWLTWSAIGLVVASLAFVKWRFVGGLRSLSCGDLAAPSAAAAWPWPQAQIDRPWPGVTHWFDRSSPDGTWCDLIEFDQGANPRLCLQLYDQDEDDARPWDDRVDYWWRGTGRAVAHLEAQGRGPIVAAWNGPFFNHLGRYSRPGPPRHLTPVVINGRVPLAARAIRWTVGVTHDGAGFGLDTQFQPAPTDLAGRFRDASGGAQCLVRGARPLRLSAPPRRGTPPPRRPVPCTADDVGPIPDVDYLRTSRTSIGWSADGRKLWLLVVKEPDSEGLSLLALAWLWPLPGGWTVPDEQRFWLALGAHGAVNLDGGDVTQALWRHSDGTATLIPPRWTSAARRRPVADLSATAPAAP